MRKPSLNVYADIYFMSWFTFQIQIKEAWNLKGGGIKMVEDELPVLHDVYSYLVSYTVQFIWRDLTSGYDIIGPYFVVPNSMDANTLQ